MLIWGFSWTISRCYIDAERSEDDAQIGEVCEGREGGMKLLIELWTALYNSRSEQAGLCGTGLIRLGTSGARTLGAGAF